MAEGEYHIASYVVSTRPEHEDEVAARIDGIAGCEVHARSDGRFALHADGRIEHRDRRRAS